MFDPTKPVDHSPLVAAEMRGQLQSLKALIDAVQSINGAQIDTVNTLNPGDPAQVSLSMSGNVIHLSFGIPRGADGAPGANGANGGNGNDGAPGPPGEVTTAQLNTAIAGTSGNTNAVATMDSPFVNDPPTLADLETMRAKMNELITALRR